MLEANSIFSYADERGEIFVLRENGAKYLVTRLTENISGEVNDQTAAQVGEGIVNISDVVFLTKEQLVDKINRDIAIWRASQNEKMTDLFEEISDFPKKDADSAEEYVYIEPVKF